MNGGEPDWVRTLYLDYLAIVLGPGYYRPPLESLLVYLEKLALLPEGEAFARAHRADLERLATLYLEPGAEQGGDSAEGARLRQAYLALGML